MKKAVVILGAGASYDMGNSSVFPNALARPPLARQLFEARFQPQRASYPGAVVIASDLAPIATLPDPFPLEQHLTAYAQSPNPVMRSNYRHLPGYLRDVLVDCTDSYVAEPASYIKMVSALLNPMSHEIMFIVLNYDTMLERALHRYDPQFTFDGLSDYTKDARAKVIKVHGSTNWLVPIPASRRLDWTVAAANYEPEPGHIALLQLIESNDRTYDITLEVNGERYRAYPWLTAPTIGKTLRCDDRHRDAMRAFLRDCHKFLVIGTSGLDTDVLEEISTAIDPAKKYLVHYVDAHGTPARERFEKAIPPFVEGANGGPLVRTSNQGFSAFLNTDGLDEFLIAD